MYHLIDELETNHTLSFSAFVQLLTHQNDALAAYLFEKSRAVAKKHFGNQIYTRGLIEFTNYCRCNCYYCGIRAGNQAISRYRLTPDQILDCCQTGYALGFRTFVLQGGEDPAFSDAQLADVVFSIKQQYPDCAVTLSAGEKSESAYRMLREAGTDRYLLRHETADPCHYAKLHPPAQTLAHRKACLQTLKRLGYQVGTGFMVGSPFQTAAHLAQDLLWIATLQPHMVGIGPFIPHKDTPFGQYPAGTLSQTLFLLGILRLMLPNALLPATTALGTIAPDGRERGILAGANVVMPNLSPLQVRKQYMLYNNKISVGEEAAEGWQLLSQKMQSIGYTLAVARGDFSERTLESCTTHTL